LGFSRTRHDALWWIHATIRSSSDFSAIAAVATFSGFNTHANVCFTPTLARPPPAQLN
jgi:hypothetical protein